MLIKGYIGILEIHRYARDQIIKPRPVTETGNALHNRIFRGNRDGRHQSLKRNLGRRHRLHILMSGNLKEMQIAIAGDNGQT